MLNEEIKGYFKVFFSFRCLLIEQGILQQTCNSKAVSFVVVVVVFLLKFQSSKPFLTIINLAILKKN